MQRMLAFIGLLPSRWPDRNSGNFTRQSKIDGPLEELARLTWGARGDVAAVRVEVFGDECCRSGGGGSRPLLLAAAATNYAPDVQGRSVEMALHASGWRATTRV